MKNFPCDILRNNVEIGWYRANAGPIQAGQCWADTIGPMLGRFRQVHRLLSWCVQCTGSVPFVPLPVQTVLASITPALAQYLYVCWDGDVPTEYWIFITQVRVKELQLNKKQTKEGGIHTAGIHIR